MSETKDKSDVGGKDAVADAQRRSFRMDPALLWSVIKSQAGTLAKALLELVMNSIDAGASQVVITLNGTSLKVEDDGRGFQSRTEVEAWFETFGTPHQEGDARWGKFRMGRGQIMSFTRNVWRSGEFEMRVDIRDLGLEYDLVEGLPPNKGCRIEGELYQPMQPSEVIRTVDNLRALCKYTPVPVIVNGEQISLDVTAERWTFEDDDAWYQLRESSRSLSVYNLGVHVRDYWNGDNGIGGIVVSKKQLSVNFARNDVLVAECEVYKRISQVVKAHAKKNEARKPAQNESYREMMLNRFLTGSFDSAEEFYRAVDEEKVFTDYSGRHLSIGGLKRAVTQACGSLVWVEDHSTKADRVHQAKLAVVISPRTYERAGRMGMPAVLQRISSNLLQFDKDSTYAQSFAQEVIQSLAGAVRPLEEVGQLINDRHRVVQEKELTREEKLTLSVLNQMQWMVGRRICGTEPREIKVCESESVDGYTDGSSVIFIERGFLRIGGSPGQALRAFEEIKALLVHEYMHDADDSTGHGHPAEFYERFHRVMSDVNEAFGFSYEATRCYLSARRKAGLKMRAGDLHTLDLVGTVEEVASSMEGVAEAVS